MLCYFVRCPIVMPYGATISVHQLVENTALWGKSMMSQCLLPHLETCNPYIRRPKPSHIWHNNWLSAVTTVEHSVESLLRFWLFMLLAMLKICKTTGLASWLWDHSILRTHDIRCNIDIHLSKLCLWRSTRGKVWKQTVIIIIVIICIQSALL